MMKFEISTFYQAKVLQEKSRIDNLYYDNQNNQNS